MVNLKRQYLEIKTEIDESGAYPQSEISTYRKVAKDAGHWEDSKNFKTIGAYERSVSHPTNKDQVKDKTKIEKKRVFFL